MAARSVSSPRPRRRSAPKPKAQAKVKEGGAEPLPDTTIWYKLGDWPLPVQVAAILKAEETGEVVGIGVYLRVPLPWDEHLTPWPTPEEKKT